MNLKFKCSADKVEAKTQNVLDRYDGVLSRKQCMCVSQIAMTRMLERQLRFNSFQKDNIARAQLIPTHLRKR